MIRDVYVLKRTGEVLVHKAFSKRGVDEVIFSGFYSALSAFAEELGHGGIETIQMGDVSFYYEHTEDLLFAIASDKGHNPKDVKIVLTEVKRQFIEKFADRVADWDGNPTPFKKFGKDIELIVSTKRTSEGHETLFTLPFALDGSKLQGKLLLDDIRRADNGFKPINEGCYEFIAKLLWPFWVVPSPENQLLLIDGLKLLQPQVARGFVPPASRYEALLKVNASPEYLAVMDKLKDEVRTAAQSTPFDIHTVPTELAHLMQQLSRITNGDNQFGVELPSRLNYGQAKKEAEQFFAEAIETHKEAANQWTQFRSHFQKDIQSWEERIQTEITTLEEHYDTRKATLKREIDGALTELAKQENRDITEVDRWRQDQEKKLLIPLKTSLEPINQEIAQQHAALEEFMAKKTGGNLGADSYLNRLNQTLDQFNTFATDLRNHSKETRKQIQQTQRALDDLDRQSDERKAKVRHGYEAQEKKEIARVDVLEEEREIRLQETRDRLDKLKSYETEVDDLIVNHINFSQNQLSTFQQYLIEPGASLPADSDKPIYVPIYLAGLKRADDTIKLIVIPPLVIPPTKQTSALSIGQRTAPVAPLSPELVKYLKEPLETALENDAKIAKEITRFSPRHNLLQDPQIESLLYSGLHALWQSQLIPERIHTQIKLSCIDIYRSSNEKA